MPHQSCADRHLRFPASVARNLALIDSATGLSAAETKGFAEIESFTPYHQMAAFRRGFADYPLRYRPNYMLNGVEQQSYDRGLMAASLCQRLGL